MTVIALVNKTLNQMAFANNYFDCVLQQSWKAPCNFHRNIHVINHILLQCAIKQATVLQTTRKYKILTHSLSLADCLPPVVRPCQSLQSWYCSSHPAEGFLALGLYDYKSTEDKRLWTRHTPTTLHRKNTLK